ncbi:hypothetical protein BGX27_002973 [Mortierella sp. AM989]|nr:hypothetical protein BGX27_002973 [Mortierella sp. AM989]
MKPLCITSFLNRLLGKTQQGRRMGQAIILLLLAHTFLLSLVQAQSSPPLPRRRVSFTKAGSKFYIQGGYTYQQGSNGAYTSQFTGLDLSTSWTVSTPSWEFLSNGGPLVSHHAMVYVAPEHAAALGTGKKGYLLTIGGSAPPTIPSFWNTFDLEVGTWAARNFPTPYQALEGHTAVASPTTGLVYIIGGFWNASNTVPIATAVNNSLTVFNPATGTIVYQSLATSQDSLIDASAVWSNTTNSILVFGGSRATSYLSSLYGLDMKNVLEINPVDFSSRRITTAGNTPTRALDLCAAVTEDGTKAVVFGGSIDTKTFSDDLFVLHVGNYTWEQRTAASMKRTRMSCGISKNQFFAWGGSSDQDVTTTHNIVPIIYDIDRNAWINNYDANGPLNSSGLPTSGNPSNPEKTNLVPIIAGAAGGVVLIGCIVAFIFYRRRRRSWKKQTYEGARITASIADDEEDRINFHARTHGGHHQQYSAVDAIEDSDIDGSNNTSERPINKAPMADHYAAATALQRPYQGGNTQSGYWDKPSAYSGHDTHLRPLSGASIAHSESFYDYSRPVTGVYGGPTSASPPLMQWQPQNQSTQQQHQPLPPLPPPPPQQQLQLQQQQQLQQQLQQPQQQLQQPQQQSQQQQQWGNYTSPSSFYYGIPAEDPRISITNQGYASQLENQTTQISNINPQPPGGAMDCNVRDSISNFSDTRTNTSARSPQSLPPGTPMTTQNYIPPPPPPASPHA